MICLVCGDTISSGIICKKCESNVSEDLCFEVAGCNVNEPKNQICSDIISDMDKPYLFRDYSIQLADFLDAPRVAFVKINCMNIMNTNSIGVSSRCREFVLNNAKLCCNSEALDETEKGLVIALLVNAYIMNYEWDNATRLLDRIELSKNFIEPYLVIADYYMRIRNYDKSLSILKSANIIFSNERDQERIDNLIKNVTERKIGNKKEYKPTKRADIENYYKFLDTLGVKHNTISNDKKNKVREMDFKPFHRLESTILPTEYVAFWITSEFCVKRNEPVELSGIKVSDGQIIDRFHSYLKPTHNPQKPKNVREEDYLNALPISSVFPTFLKFVDGNIMASLGFYEQGELLSILARYSNMEEIKNVIFDVIEYYEDNSDDFETYTRETLLKKFGITEGGYGEEKAEKTFEMVEKMRQE